MERSSGAGFYCHTKTVINWRYITFETPKRHFLGRKHVLWAIARRNWSSGVARTQCEEYTNKKTKGRTKSGNKLGVCPAHPLIPICTIFCMLGGHPDVFLKFEFQNDWSRNLISEPWGVEIRPLPLTRLIAYTTACCYRTSRDLNTYTGILTNVKQQLQMIRLHNKIKFIKIH